MIKPIHMTREMIEDCLLNSPVFRAAVIEKLMAPELDVIHNKVLRLMREVGGHQNKIAFIKAIREASEGQALDFARAFPSIVRRSDYEIHPVPKCLGLADSKHIAESYINLHSPCTQ